MKGLRKQAGDTIIEVMAAIAILALALGGAYALSNSSFQTAINTNNRVVALGLAQGQTEFLKNTGLNGQAALTTLLSNNPNGQKFCFLDSNGTTAAASTTPCTSYGGSIYNVSVGYCASGGGCGQPNVFTVEVHWLSTSRGAQKNLTVYYKPPS